MNRSMPGLPVHHQRSEFTQTQRPSSWWCHPAISSSVVLFSSCSQFLLGSESFLMSQPTLHMRWPKYWSFSFSIYLPLGKINGKWMATCFQKAKTKTKTKKHPKNHCTNARRTGKWTKNKHGIPSKDIKNAFYNSLSADGDIDSFDNWKHHKEMSQFLEEFQKDRCQLFSKCLIEFVCKAIWSFTFVCWKFLNQTFKFSTYDWSVHIFYFFLVQS